MSDQFLIEELAKANADVLYLRQKLAEAEAELSKIKFNWREYRTEPHWLRSNLGGERE